MANKALKLRVKAEAGELQENAGIGVAPVKKVKEQERHGTSAHPMLMPSTDNLLEVPPEKAMLADYPPGCPVLHTDTSVVPLIVSKGTVESVFVDLSPGAPRDYVYTYKVSFGRETNPVIVRHVELQLAPYCPVWVQPLQENPGAEWWSAFVIGSYQGMANEDPQYSIQEDEPGTYLFHGITKDRIRYRSDDDDNGQHEAPPIMTETDAAGRIHASEPPQSVMTSTPTPISSQIQTPAHRKFDTNVTRVTTSPRKRPLQSEWTTTEASPEDPTMGQCSAEFRMPYWIKARLSDDLIDKMCRGVKAGTDCRARVLDSARKTDVLAGQSIFVYGREMNSVEHACDFVSDLLREFVSKKKERKRLVKELRTGWRKNNYGETETLPGVRSGVNGYAETSSTVYCDIASSPKKAKTERSPSKEEGEIVSRSMHDESTSKVLFQNNGSVSEQNTERQSIVDVDTLPGEASTLRSTRENEVDTRASELTPQALLQNSSAEPAADTEASSSTPQALLQNSSAGEEPAAEPAAVAEASSSTQQALLQNSSADEEAAADPAVDMLPNEAGPVDIQPGPLTRVIKVPQFADDNFVREALIGEDERNRNYLFHETGCDIRLNMPGCGNRSSLLDPIEVILTGAFDADYDSAQQLVENGIVSTVPEDQRGRMLYYLAKDNNYGASEGQARYQRSHFDLKTWCWMSVVELPSGFERLAGLFIDTHGKAIKAIIRKSGCNHINLSGSFPKHVYLCSPNLDMLNAAMVAVNDRVLWALREGNSRRNKRW